MIVLLIITTCSPPEQGLSHPHQGVRSSFFFPSSIACIYDEARTVGPNGKSNSQLSPICHVPIDADSFSQNADFLAL